MDLATLGLKVQSTEVDKAAADLDKLAKEAKQADHAVDQLEKSTGKAAKTQKAMNDNVSRSSMSFNSLAKSVGGLVAAYATFQIVGATVGKFLAETVEMEDEQNKLAAALKATGERAGQSQEELNKFAAEMMATTRFSDGAVASAQLLALKFERLGGDVFPRAMKAAADFAAISGRDLPAAMQLIGSALNNPEMGFRKLQQAGVVFTDSQKETIKTMMDTGRAAEAQAIMLERLEGSFGGAAKASRETLGGALDALKIAFGELFELKNTEPLRLAIEGLIVAISNPAFAEFVTLIGQTIFVALTAAATVALAFANAIGFVAMIISDNLLSALIIAGPLLLAAFGPVALAAVSALGTAITGLLIPAVVELFAILMRNPWVAGFTAALVAVDQLIKRTVGWKAVIQETIELLGKMAQVLGEVVSLFGGEGGTLKGLGEEIEKGAAAFAADLTEALATGAEGMKNKIGLGSQEGAGALASGVDTGSTAGADKLAAGVERGAQAGAATMEQIYKSLNGTIEEGVKLIRNEFTGEIKKAGGQAGAAIGDGVNKAAAGAGVQFATAAAAPLDDLSQQFGRSAGAQIGNQLMMFAPEIAELLVRKLRAEVRKINAEAMELDARAMKERAEAQYTDTKARTEREIAYNGRNGPRGGSVGVGGGWPKFAKGGSFEVGGNGFGDKTPVAFWADPGEKVTVTPANESTKPEVKLTVVNQNDPNGILDAMSTSDGQNVILNTLTQNPEYLRSLMGRT